jgi:hypothetical protein
MFYDSLRAFLHSMPETTLMWMVPAAMVVFACAVWYFSVWMTHVEMWCVDFIDDDDTSWFLKFFVGIPLIFARLWLLLLAIVTLGVMVVGAHQIAKRSKEWWKE